MVQRFKGSRGQGKNLTIGKGKKGEQLIVTYYSFCNVNGCVDGYPFWKQCLLNVYLHCNCSNQNDAQ